MTLQISLKRLFIDFFGRYGGIGRQHSPSVSGLFSVLFSFFLFEFPLISVSPSSDTAQILTDCIKAAAFFAYSGRKTAYPEAFDPKSHSFMQLKCNTNYIKSHADLPVFYNLMIEEEKASRSSSRQMYMFIYFLNKTAQAVLAVGDLDTLKR